MRTLSSMFCRPPRRVAIFFLCVFVAGARDGRAQSGSDEHLAAEEGHDFSAFRLDCDVFGWNKDFTEVASVNTEVRRYPKGKQRGEGFLLVHALGRPWPLHNVVLHYITHADLKDPLPLEDVRENMWLIDYQFQNMWPKRPMRHQPSGAMKVTVLMEPVPTEALVHAPPSKTSAAEAGPAASPKPSHTMGAGTGAADACTPYVGFILDWHGQRRIVNMLPLDMHARCGTMSMDDKRVYWGRADIAAAMVRINFAADREHEETARFVSSASWRLASTLMLHVRARGPLSYHARQDINRKLLAFGQVHFFDGRTDKGLALANAQALYPVRVHASHKWLALGHYLGRLLGNDNIELVELPETDHEGEDLRVLTFDYAEEMPAAPDAAPPVKSPEPSALPAERLDVSKKPARHSPVFGADVPGDLQSSDAPPIADPTLLKNAKDPDAVPADHGRYLDP